MSATITAARPALSRPNPNEHAEYAITYVNATAAALEAAGLDDVRDLLALQPSQLDVLLASVTEDESERAYAANKWSLKESIVHMADVERVFSYRLLRTARGDTTPLAGFEHNDYVPESRANARSFRDIIAELKAVRAASLALVQSLDETALTRAGTASSNPITPRGLAWLITGHFAHHMSLFQDRYVPALRA